jgi:hypothetical protein
LLTICRALMAMPLKENAVMEDITEGQKEEPMLLGPSWEVFC